MTRFREAILFLLPALVLGAVLAAVDLSGADRSAFLRINHDSQVFGVVFWQCVTILGDGLVALVLVLPFVRSRPALAWNTLVSSLLVLGAVQGIKHFDMSVRPLQVLPPESVNIIGPSLRLATFPSGHSATAFMLAGIFWLYFRNVWVRSGVVAAAVLIAVSRIAVGVHWPVDSLAGGIIGWLSAGLGYHLTKLNRYLDHSATKIFMQVLLAGCAVSLLVHDHTSYPYGFRFQQVIALACLGLLLAEILRGNKQMFTAQK